MSDASSFLSVLNIRTLASDFSKSTSPDDFLTILIFFPSSEFHSKS